MKKVYATITLAVSTLILGCGPNTKKTENGNLHPASGIVDTQMSASPKMDDVPDPDPTDTIPTGEYLSFANNPQTADLVRQSLAALLKDDIKAMTPEQRKFVFYETDLNEDGKKEIFVGFRSSYMCGTGGCSAYILNPDGTERSRFSVSDYPFVVMPTKTNGWHDLVVRSGNLHLLKFDGKKYPSNPSVQPQFNQIPGDDLERALFLEYDKYPWFSF